MKIVLLAKISGMLFPNPRKRSVMIIIIDQECENARSKVLTGECAYREDELESFVLSIPEDKTQSEFFDIICEHLIRVGFSVKYSEPILAVVLKADIRVILNDEGVFFE